MKRYILTDGNGNYIRRDRVSGKYVPVNKMSHAERFDNLEKAERIRRSAIGKRLKNSYYAIVVEEAELPKPQQERKEKARQEREARAAQPGKSREIDLAEVPKSDIENQIVHLLMCAEQLLSKKEALYEQQSNIDTEVSDLQHYIEQRDLNAYQGYLVYKRLQSTLVRRRTIKDELMVLSIIEECRMDTGSITTAIARLEGMNTRKYAPRILSDLFERGIANC